jgi:hypothetical protein
MLATDYRTQAEAERDARGAVWGDVPFAQRAEVSRTTYNGTRDPLGVVAHVDRLQVIAVAATVNGRTVVFTFDHWGRRASKPLVLPKTR